MGPHSRNKGELLIVSLSRRNCPQGTPLREPHNGCNTREITAGVASLPTHSGIFRQDKTGVLAMGQASDEQVYAFNAC